MSISGYVLICFSHILKGGGNHHFSRTQPHLNQVLLIDRHEIQAIKITFLSHKQNCKKAPFSLVVSRQNFLLPVQHLLFYLKARVDNPGPLFQMCNESPVPRSVFYAKLSAVIKLIRLVPLSYKDHAFCIGAASHAADKGMSN